MRDDFSNHVKDNLAKRVGFRCSNPGCRQPTSGPQQEASGVVNVGVAAHITAASSGGPRFNPNFNQAERTSADNGIWLCQTCAKLVDSDESAYPVERLHDWKRSAEKAAARDLENRRAPDSGIEAIFLEAQRIMPELINEMRDDIRQDQSGLIREFVILPNRNCIFNHTKPRFVYYAQQHPYLKLQIDWLLEMGLVTYVRCGNSPIYRMQPVFVDAFRHSTNTAH